MYKALVRPILEYAAEVISYKHYYFTERKSTAVEEPPEMIKRIENLQNRIPKKLLCCPKNTHPAVVRIPTGVMPMSARIDMLKLRYFWKLQHTQIKNIAHEVHRGLRKNFIRGSVGMYMKSSTFAVNMTMTGVTSSTQYSMYRTSTEHVGTVEPPE